MADEVQRADEGRNEEKDGIRARTAKEIRRLNKMLRDGGAGDGCIKSLRPIVENTAWMKAKLDDARAEIRDGQIAVEYDNGGGQKGVRENPLFKGYESLWKAYMLGMARLLDAMPEADAAKAEKEQADQAAPATVLDLVMARRRANG